MEAKATKDIERLLPLVFLHTIVKQTVCKDSIWYTPYMYCPFRWNDFGRIQNSIKLHILIHASDYKEILRTAKQ